ncbi:hypothetical protein VCV18_001614 [Metarhizium anisopliae]
MVGDALLESSLSVLLFGRDKGLMAAKETDSVGRTMTVSGGDAGQRTMNNAWMAMKRGMVQGEALAGGLRSA